MSAFTIDLDADRKARAAAREGGGHPIPIILGGRTVATLPVELPLDVLAPLRELDGDLTMLIRTVVDAARSEGDQRVASTDLIIDMLAMNPRLPMALIDVVRDITRALVGDDGYQAFIDERLTREDIGYLIKGVLGQYGVSLGESLGSSGSPAPDGETSSTTSKPTSARTPEGSGLDQETPDSLVSAAS